MVLVFGLLGWGGVVCVVAGGLDAQEVDSDPSMVSLDEMLAAYAASFPDEAGDAPNAGGDLLGAEIALLQVPDGLGVEPSDRSVFGRSFIDDPRFAPPATSPEFWESALEYIAMRLPVVGDPRTLTGPRDEFGPYFVVGDDPVYEGGGPTDPNFDKNRGINLFRGPDGWVSYSTVYDGSFNNVPTGTIGYLLPESVVILIPVDEVDEWTDVTVWGPGDSVDVEVTDLPVIVVESITPDGELVVVVDDPSLPTTTIATTDDTEPTSPPVATTEGAATATAEGEAPSIGAPTLALGALVAVLLGVGLFWVLSRRRPEEGPCDDELRFWQGASAEAERSAAVAAQAWASVDKLDATIDGLRADLADGNLSPDGPALLEQHLASLGNRAARARAAQEDAEEARHHADALWRAYLDCMGLGSTGTAT